MIKQPTYFNSQKKHCSTKPRQKYEDFRVTFELRNFRPNPWSSSVENIDSMVVMQILKINWQSVKDTIKKVDVYARVARSKNKTKFGHIQFHKVPILKFEEEAM